MGSRTILAAVLVSLLHASCASAPERALPPSSPRHVVVLIHGIFGDRTHFGRMEDALRAHLPKLEPEVRHEVVSFEYDTFDGRKRTPDFARDLDAALKALFPEGPREQDRLSFVMHSQGGLVGLRWVALASGDDERSRALLARLDAFVTLATPYWGSKMATFTRVLEPLRARRPELPAAPGDAQLRDMSFGSDVLVQARRAAVARARATPPRGMDAARRPGVNPSP